MDRIRTRVARGAGVGDAVGVDVSVAVCVALTVAVSVGGSVIAGCAGVGEPGGDPAIAGIWQASRRNSAKMDRKSL